MQHHYRSGCPQCGSDIPTSHIFGTAVVCSRCSWSGSATREEIERQQSQKILFQMIAAAILMLSSLYYVAKWNNYSLKVIPLQAKILSQMATTSDLFAFAEICENRKLYSQAMDTYRVITEKFPEEKLAYLHLGQMRLRSKMYQESILPLLQYLKRDNANLDVHYDLARAYGHIGDVQKSMRHFKYVLIKKPKILQVTVVRNYVNMLIANGHLKTAQRVIVQYRRKSGQREFLMKEWQQIQSTQS